MRMPTVQFIQFVIHTDKTDEMQIDVFITIDDLMQKEAMPRREE